MLLLIILVLGAVSYIPPDYYEEKARDRLPASVITREKAEIIAADAADYYVKFHSVPSDSIELYEKYLKGRKSYNAVYDSWRNPFKIEFDESKGLIFVTSYGSDRKPGGDLADQDILVQYLIAQIIDDS